MDDQRWRERAGSFGAAAEVYDRSRPSYPVEAVRWALASGAQRVLDLGAGTGKLTAVLLDLGLDVVAVEPSEEMRERIPARAQVLEGTAELAAPERAEFRHEQLLDADLLVDLVASRSALITMPEAERVEVLQRVRELAPAQEPFALPYVTEVWRSVRA